jgi:hypothetical protein
LLYHSDQPIGNTSLMRSNELNEIPVRPLRPWRDGRKGMSVE